MHRVLYNNDMAPTVYLHWDARPSLHGRNLSYWILAHHLFTQETDENIVSGGLMHNLELTRNYPPTAVLRVGLDFDRGSI